MKQYFTYFAYQPDFAEKVGWTCRTLLDEGFEHLSAEDLIKLQD